MGKIFSMLAMAVLLSACSDSNTSSEDSSSSNTVNNNSVSTTFSSRELTEGDILIINYDLDTSNLSKNKEGTTGTIHWGDGTTERVRGSGQAKHRYKASNTYSVAVQVDGQEGMRLGEVRVESAPVPETANQTNLPAIATSVDISCAGSTLTVKSPSTNRTYSVSIGLGSPAPINVTDLSTGEATTTMLTADCPSIGTGTTAIPFAFPTAPTVVIDATFTAGSSTFTIAPQ